jgi:hypothetical protein
MDGHFFIASESGGKWFMEVTKVSGIEGKKPTCWHSPRMRLARSMP